jgi:uncharacterized membrane protein YkoI
LLHVAAEFGNVEAARLLLARGAQVDARARVDEAGIGGQTPLFHAVTQFDDRGLPMTQLLLEHGADLSVRVKLPGHYERSEEVVECTPLEYGLLFPGVEGKTVRLLRERGGAATPSATVAKTRPGITEEVMNKDERTREERFKIMRELELMKQEAEVKLKYIRETSGTTLTEEQEAELKEEMSGFAQYLEEGLRREGYKGWPPSETQEQEQEFDAKLLAQKMGIKAGREDELAKLPKIPMQQAIEIATAQQPGTVLECRLVGRVVEDLWLAFYDVRIASVEGAERTFTRFAISWIDGRILDRINQR